MNRHGVPSLLPHVVPCHTLPSHLMLLPPCHAMPCMSHPAPAMPPPTMPPMFPPSHRLLCPRIYQQAVAREYVWWANSSEPFDIGSTTATAFCLPYGQEHGDLGAAVQVREVIFTALKAG